MRNLTRSGGSLRRTLKSVVAATIVVGIALSPSYAHAKSPVTMTVEAGYGGIYRAGSPFPVSVVVRSTRAVSGDLEVVVSKVDGGSDLYRMRVEIPGGGRKRFDMAVPPPPRSNQHVVVRLRDGKTLLAREQVSLATTEDVKVGVVASEIPLSLQSIDLVPTMKRPKVFEVSQGRVAIGEIALAPLDYLIVYSGEGDVSAANAKSINSWVTSGGRLIVVAEDIGSVGWLPKGWTADPESRVRQGTVSLKRVGLGESITVQSSWLAATSDKTLWQELLRPVMSQPRGSGFEGEPSAAFQLANALTRPKGQIVKLDLFFIFLIAYLILVGPVNYVVLKRKGRRELAWVTIPLISVVFSGAAFGFARSNKELQRVHHAVVSLSSEEFGRANHLVAVGAASRSDIAVTFDARFAQSVSSFEGSGSRSTRVTELRGGKAVAQVQTAPFSVAAVSGEGRAVKGYLDADLAWDGHGFVGKVVNRTAFKMREVIVWSGTDHSSVGSLGPGESADVVVVSSAESDVRRQADGIPSDMMVIDGHPEGQPLEELLRSWFTETTRVEGGGALVMGIADGVPASAEVRGGPSGRSGTVALVASPATVTVKQEARTIAPVAGGWWLAGSDTAQGWEFGGCSTPSCGQMGVVSLNGFKEATFGSRLPAGVDRARIRSGRIVIAGSNGLLRGDSPTGPIQSPEVRFDRKPVPVPLPPQGQQGETGVIVAPPAPDVAAGTFRFQFWDWQKGAWVEGELWPGGKDVVPPTAISSLGESFVKIIASNPSGTDIVGAGVEWDVS